MGTPMKSYTLFLATTACAVVACSSSSTSHADAAEWTRAVNVSTTTGGGAAPVFAASPSGALALAWVAAPNAGTDGRLFVRPGARQDSVSELRDSLGSLSIYGEVPPKIAYAPDGRLYAAYLVTKIVPGMRWPQNALRFAVSRDGGRRWDAPSTVTGDAVFGSYDDHALFVAPDGSVFLTWLAEVAHDTSHTFFARSTDGGKTWSKPMVIDSDRSCPCCRTTMAAGPDGSLYVAWRKRFAGDERDIVVAKSNDKGATWSAPVRVYNDRWAVNYCPDAGPSIKADSEGTVHVAWWTGKNGRAGTQYARSTDGGRTFTAPVDLGLAQQSRAAHIQLAVGHGAQKGLVVAAWDDGTRMVPQIVVRVSRDGGRTFAPASAISAPENQAGYPVVTLRGDTAIVAWQERSLGAAAEDSAAKAKMSHEDPAMYVNAVGAMKVVMRSAVLGGER